jgi:hypothetical protein
MSSFTIPAGHKPGACCAKEDRRYTMKSAVLMRGATGSFITATDGKVLSVLPVECSAHNAPVLLPPKALDAGAQDKTCDLGKDQLKTTTTGKNHKTSLYPLPKQEGKYPDFKELLPEDVSHCHAIILDATLLANLASAISPAGIVTLYVPASSTKPILVIGTDEARPTGFGLIMQMQLEEYVQASKLDWYKEQLANIPAGITRIEVTEETDAGTRRMTKEAQ